ncbi:uncharacterized protein LOC126889302 [Diabrotica virgifera virgifera]|uniref:HAT C-terminal dimerisation domain-containing protein n=1 Tax=Diabrotica virgifera virgifera TaxID=50390 RepID=A0ABM5KT97_DIAVI|nr:uncharacterized protein LOC126889302 [Diabrotica virgifera virgifera]
MVHLIIGALKEDEPGKPYLIAAEQLEKTNNVTVSRFIQQTLSAFFLPTEIKSEHFLIFLSDAAPYMVKVEQNLKIFYPNMVHVTCLLPGINRIAEVLRGEFDLVNKLISNVKKVFLKAPLRVQMYKEKLPGVNLPPEPVITRWGTWIKAAIFYANHFDAIKDVVLDIQNDSQCVTESQELLSNVQIAKELMFIKVNFSFLPDLIKSLEQRNLQLSDSGNLVNTFSAHCQKIPGNTGITIRNKLKNVLEKNEGFDCLRKVVSIFEGNFSEDLTTWQISLLPKLKYCLITSVDVERTFSVSTHVFSDRRQKLLVENFEKYLIINSYYNLDS